jgi:hypothetical protein
VRFRNPSLLPGVARDTGDSSADLGARLFTLKDLGIVRPARKGIAKGFFRCGRSMLDRRINRGVLPRTFLLLPAQKPSVSKTGRALILLADILSKSAAHN